MPFISSYTTSYKARHSRNVDPWTPDGGVFRATSGLSFWIDANDTSSYTSNTTGLTSITDKAGGNAITINNSGTNNDNQPVAFTSQNGVPSSMPVFEFSGESFTTGEFAQVDSDGNHWSIALVRAGNDGPSNPYGDSFSTFWSTENSTVASGSRRDYGLELGSASYFYGQLSLDSLNTPDRVNNDDVVQYGGIYSDPNVNTDQNLLRFDGYGTNTNYVERRTWFIMAIVFNKTGNQILVRVNGENAFTPVDYDNSLNTDLSLRIGVNRTHDNSETHMHCQVAELMTFAGKPGTGGTDLSEVERVEGYLAHKWANQSLLPTTHPYRNYSQASLGDWNPSQGFPKTNGHMNPTLWIDIHDGQNYTYDSANTDITSITDKSGNGTITLQNYTPPDGLIPGDVVTTSSGPYIVGENRLEYIRMNFFNNQNISLVVSNTKIADNGNHWAIGFMNWGSIQSNDETFWHTVDNSGNDRHYAVESRSTYSSAGWAGQTNLGGDITDTSLDGDAVFTKINWGSAPGALSPSVQSASIIALCFNKDGNQIRARVNGADTHTIHNDYDNGLEDYQDVILFRSRVDSGLQTAGAYLDGSLYEFFIFADLPGTGGTDISFLEIAEGYLAHKWDGYWMNNAGLVSKLPNDHPYKNSAP